MPAVMRTEPVKRQVAIATIRNLMKAANVEFFRDLTAVKAWLKSDKLSHPRFFVEFQRLQGQADKLLAKTLPHMSRDQFCQRYRCE